MGIPLFLFFLFLFSFDFFHYVLMKSDEIINCEQDNYNGEPQDISLE
jgi:hypothetical protein